MTLRRMIFISVIGLIQTMLFINANAKPPYDNPDKEPFKPQRLDHPLEGMSPEIPLPDPITTPGSFFNLPPIDESVWVVAGLSKKPYWQVGLLDPVLTEACQLGDFVTPFLNRIVVKFEGPIGQGFLQTVMPQHRHLLIDRRHLAKPNETYFFLDTGLPTCQVWLVGSSMARSFPKGRGSSLPLKKPLRARTQPRS